MLSLREDTFEHQVFGGTFAVRHIIHRSIWNLRATSVLSDFTGFEAAELKVIVTKWRIAITNQTMHFITLYAAFHFEVRCFVLVSYHITSEVK